MRFPKAKCYISLLLCASALHGQTHLRHFESVHVDTTIAFDSVATAPTFVRAGRIIVAKIGSTAHYIGAGYVGTIWHNLDSVAGNTVGPGWFGDPVDGDYTQSTTYDSATRDMFFNNFTIPAGDTFRTKSYRIFVQGTITINGNLTTSGRPGGNGGNADSVICGDFNTSLGGAGGSPGSGDVDGYLAGSSNGSTLAGGGEPGGTGSSTTDCVTGVSGYSGPSCGAGAFTKVPDTVTYGIGSQGIQGDSGGAGGNALACIGTGNGQLSCAGQSGGPFTPIESTPSVQDQYGLPHDLILQALGRTFAMSITSASNQTARVGVWRMSGTSGGGRGGGGGGSGSGGGHIGRGAGGGGGGGGGGNGGSVVLVANIITGTGSITADGAVGGKGGNGGKATVNGSGACAGGGGGGGGGAGGSAGIIIICTRSMTGVTTSAVGGAGGQAGIGGTGAGNGTAGDNGKYHSKKGNDGLVIINLI